MKINYIPNRVIDMDGIADGAEIHVYQTGTTTPVLLYIDSNYSTPVSNPYIVAAGAAVPPLYANATSVRVVIVTDNGTEDYDPYDPLALDIIQPVTPQQFGAVADGVTDDSAAIQAAINSLRDGALTGYDYSKGSSSLFLPRGVYFIGNTSLDVWHTLRIYGETTGGAGGAATVIKSNDGHTSIRLQTELTSGDSTVTAANAYGGAYGSCIEGIHFEGGYTLSETSGHGILMRAKAEIKNCHFRNYSGDGIHIAASSGLGSDGEGNANGWRVDNCFIQNCKNGIFIDGSDANAGHGIDVNTKSCRQWGVYDSSFLGNKFTAGQHATNGYRKVLNPAETWTPSIVSYGGNWYSPVIGQETGASTNTPPSATVTITIASPGVVTWTAHGLVTGTPVAFSTTGALPTGFVANTTYYVVTPTTNTFQLAATVGGAAINTSGSQSGVHTASSGTDNTWWYYLFAGGPNTTSWNIPTWTNGITVRTSGPFGTDNGNAVTQFTGCYAEGDQAPCQLSTATLVIGGAQASRIIGAALNTNNSKPSANDAMTVTSTKTPSNHTLLGSGDDVTNGFLTVYNSGYSGSGALSWGVLSGNNLYFTNWRTSLGPTETPFIVSTQAASLTDAPWGINRINFPLGYGLGGKKIQTGTAAPVANAYNVGDIVINSAPSAGGTLLWYCTVAGTPGTWVAMTASSGTNTGDETSGTVVAKLAGQALTPLSVAIGSGTVITKTVVYTPTLTPASVAAATVAEQTFTVTGLTTADTVSINVPSIANATGIAGVRVSAADTLAIRFVNPTAGALTPTSGVYRIIAHRS